MAGSETVITNAKVQESFNKVFGFVVGDPEKLEIFTKKLNGELKELNKLDTKNDTNETDKQNIIKHAQDKLAAVKSALEAAATTATTMNKSTPPEIERALQAIAPVTVTTVEDAKIAEGVVNTAQQAEQSGSGKLFTESVFSGLTAMGELAAGVVVVAQQYLPDNLKHLSAGALNELQMVMGKAKQFMSQTLGDGENKIAANKMEQGNDITSDDKLAVAVNLSVKKSSALNGLELG